LGLHAVFTASSFHVEEVIWKGTLGLGIVTARGEEVKTKFLIVGQRRQELRIEEVALIVTGRT
jgi:hypothetical protein